MYRLNKSVKYTSVFCIPLPWILAFYFWFLCECSRTFLYLLVRLFVCLAIYLSVIFFLIYCCRFLSRHTIINIVLEYKSNRANNANLFYSRNGWNGMASQFKKKLSCILPPKIGLNLPSYKAVRILWINLFEIVVYYQHRKNMLSKNNHWFEL